MPPLRSLRRWRFPQSRFDLGLSDLLDRAWIGCVYYLLPSNLGKGLVVAHRGATHGLGCEELAIGPLDLGVRIQVESAADRPGDAAFRPRERQLVDERVLGVTTLRVPSISKGVVPGRDPLLDCVEQTGQRRLARRLHTRQR